MGTCWVLGSWADGTWGDGTWVDVETNPPVAGQGEIVLSGLREAINAPSRNEIEAGKRETI